VSSLTQQFKAQSTLMIQGCTSDAGKSVMVAGLCRWLARKQAKVAPFKPQNMALNSAVTVDGGEIGRAQAVQAQACYLPAHTDFNPILLKPSSDTGAQVIVHGHAINSMQAGQYHDYKKVALQAVLDSYHRLDQQYHKIIVEGAGSPAEINLRDNDLANMGFAESVDCPVLLIADIDRGGVFAHLIGTLELLSKTEQDRVVGFVINRFRGDIKLLEPGLQWLEQRTGKPVIGVMPYLQNFFLDAEDSIASSQITAQNNATKFKVVVPVLPRISNHTDFDALRMHPDVDLEFVAVQQKCPAADLIVLPGSKNVLSDLQTLKNNGWSEVLKKHLRYGGKVIGICGGYQMLGEALEDPHAIETGLGHAQGFGLLPVRTVLKPEKQLKHVTGRLLEPALTPVSFQAYEIHCGVTTRRLSADKKTTSLARINSVSNNGLDGDINVDNNALGTYLHGIFDQPEACRALLFWAGLVSTHAPDLNAIREQQLDRLADCIDAHLDVGFLTQLLASNTPDQNKGQERA